MSGLTSISILKQIQLSPQCKQYLNQRAFISPISTALVPLFLCMFFKAGPPAGWILSCLVVVIAIMTLRTSRWVSYIAVACGILTVVAWVVFVDANGAQDAASDRDDAVEIAAAAVLHGSNPWGHQSILGLPITTGPTSILMALPFVGVLGKINLLTFIMWSSFVTILALADIRQRNNTFFTACIPAMPPLVRLPSHPPMES